MKHLYRREGRLTRRSNRFPPVFFPSFSSSSFLEFFQRTILRVSSFRELLVGEKKKEESVDLKTCVVYSRRTSHEERWMYDRRS